MRKILFLRVGLPFGVLVALASARGWWEVAITTLVVALVFAAILAVVIRFCVRHLKRSPLTDVVVFLAILTTVVGSGVAILFVVYQLPHGRWYQLPATPEAVQAFVGPTCHRMNGTDDLAVFVRGGSGQTYGYHGERAAWRMETPVQAGAIDEIRSCRALLLGSPAVPTPPGAVAARYQIDDNGVDCGGRRYYLLLSNGTVWTWSTGSCALAMLFGIFFFAIAFVVLTVVAFRSRHAPQNAPALVPPGVVEPLASTTHEGD